MVLRFSYKQAITPNGRLILRPMISTSIAYESQKVDGICLLDSGADITLLSRGMAVDLGINLSRRPLKAKGLTGAIRVIQVNVNLTLTDGTESHEIDIPAFVNLETTNEVEAVLGRAGLFDKFRITFIESEGVVLMEREDRRIGSAGVEPLCKILRRNSHPCSANPIKASGILCKSSLADCRNSAF
jgi:hypothetical protein